MQILILLILLETAHWVSDFTSLTTMPMILAKKRGTPLGPIFHHAWRCALIKGLALGYFAFFCSIPFTTVLICSLIELITHFLIDTAKGQISNILPDAYDHQKQLFWSILGADQSLHHIVMFAIASLMTSTI